jgi:cellulose synthase (UDP-forming)
MMNSTDTPSRPNRSSARRNWLANWLLQRVPGFFDHRFSWATRQQLGWLTLLLLVLSVPLIITPLQVWQQIVVAVLLIAIGWLIVRIERQQAEQSSSEYMHLFLVWLSIITSSRYLYYRFNYTLNFDGWVNTFFCVLLLGAELYAFFGLLLAYFQTLKLKEREPIDLATIPQDQWYKVDVYIPTYNEDVEIVRKTALAALAIDYPADKKQVYVLDDGRKFAERREQLQQMCAEIGCTLLTRDNNDHAKAGNINTALRRTQGDLVLILDCDHIPSRNFLQNTVGFFFDPKIFLVQTPHWFYNPDPFERNLLTGGQVPVSNELFYKVVQKGNDFWNAAFFCGSAAVIRRAHLLQIGGIAVETVTEDCHTSFRLHSLGYESIYYDKIMIAGLAPEKFSALVGQQVRWARGMAQIMRIENPLLNLRLKLSLPQRLCYFSAMFGFFYGFPRLIYAIMPTLFLLFGINPIRGLGVETLAYALPHILLSMNANYITSKNVRFSFWNELFEFALSFYTGIVTLMALINPKMGSFNVTAKGLSVSKRSFDWESARPILIVGVLVVLSLVAVPFWLLLRPEDSEAVLVNMMWSGFNLILILGALLVALEQPQLRRAHRLNRELPAVLYSQNQTWHGKTTDASEAGARVIIDSWLNIPDIVELELVGDYGSRAFVPAQVVRSVPINESQTLLALEFVNLNQNQQDSLNLVLYSDVREWYSQKREIVDDPLQSLRFIATSLKRSFRDRRSEPRTKVRKRIQAEVELYWEGHLYSARATEMGTRNLRLLLDELPQWQIEILQRTKPVVGLSVKDGDAEAERLLAIVQQVELTSDSGDSKTQVAIELRFPEALTERQQPKVQQLLAVLN